MSWPTLVDITLLSLRVSLVSTTVILLPGVALGFLLARLPFRGKALLRTLIALPLVLPPVAIGLFLLVLLAQDGPLGRTLEALFGGTVILTWWAAALASAVMSFPLLVFGAQQGFESVPRRLEQVARSLGAGRWQVFRQITLPLARRGILYGAIFAFARGLGEFGATTLVAGHIPGRTETLSLAIYARIEQFEDGQALLLCGVSILLALTITGAAELLWKERSA